MTRCFCGMDHDAERARGAHASALARTERWGPPFETIAEGGWIRRGQPMELRAFVDTDYESGAWRAMVYVPDYEEIAGCETGLIKFLGWAPTETRAQALARQAAATIIAAAERWQAEHR